MNHAFDTKALELSRQAIALFFKPMPGVQLQAKIQNLFIAAMEFAAPAVQEGQPVSQPYTLREWIPCSYRMPDDDDFVYIWPRPDFGIELHVGQYCKFHKKGDGWYAQVNEQNYGIEWYPITVTHWMPLPAAPFR